MANDVRFSFEIQRQGNTTIVAAMPDGSDHFPLVEIVVTNVGTSSPQGMLEAKSVSLLDKRTWTDGKPEVAEEIISVEPIMPGKNALLGRPKGTEHVVILRTYNDEGKEEFTWAHFTKQRKQDAEKPRVFVVSWRLDRFGLGDRPSWNDGSHDGLWEEVVACEGGKCGLGERGDTK